MCLLTCENSLAEGSRTVPALLKIPTNPHSRGARRATDRPQAARGMRGHAGKTALGSR